mmetsp:Transcript_31211/g.76135  ORF Transcript_31211/g.76135 Transcript_31211/m.76135 type:complete len:398 (-) Transcript_31211:89-1282(-)
MRCSSVWIATDAIKAALDLSQIAFAVHQLHRLRGEGKGRSEQKALNAIPSRIYGLSLLIAVLAVPYHLGQHEPLYCGWEFVLAFSSAAFACYMVGVCFLAYLIVSAHYTSSRLGNNFPSWTKWLFGMYAATYFAALFVSVVLTGVTNEVKHSSIKHYALGVICTIVGIHFIGSLRDLRQMLNDSFKKNAQIILPSPKNHSRSMGTSDKQLSNHKPPKKRELATNDDSKLVLDRLVLDSLKVGSKEDNPLHASSRISGITDVRSTVKTSSYGIGTTPSGQESRMNSSPKLLKTLSQDEKRSYRATRILQQSERSRARHKRSLKKIDGTLLIAFILTILIGPIEVLYAISLQLDDKNVTYKEDADRWACEYDPIQDMLLFLGVAFIFMMQYYAYKRQET